MQPFHSVKPDLWPVEKFVAYLSFAFLAFNLVEIVRRNISVDWAGYGVLLGTIVFTLAIGQYYRISGKSARIGAALTTTGLMLLFTMALSSFNYVLLPTVFPSIDSVLVTIDSALGFHWPDSMVFFADYPTVNSVLKYAYISTLPQLACLLIILGLSGKIHELHVLLAVVSITATLAVFIWYFFPSHGANSIFTIPSEIENAINPVLKMEYGRELIRLAAEGPGLLSPQNTKGLIAFPSYHSTLAFIAIYSARNVRWLFPGFLVLNLLILPATVIQGGHHLIDVIAGLVLFLVGVWMAKKLVQHQTGTYPSYLEPEFSR